MFYYSFTERRHKHVSKSTLLVKCFIVVVLSTRTSCCKGCSTRSWLEPPLSRRGVNQPKKHVPTAHCTAKRNMFNCTTKPHFERVYQCVTLRLCVHLGLHSFTTTHYKPREQLVAIWRSVGIARQQHTTEQVRIRIAETHVQQYVGFLFSLRASAFLGFCLRATFSNIHANKANANARNRRRERRFYIVQI